MSQGFWGVGDILVLDLDAGYTGMFHLWKFIEPYTYDFVYYLNLGSKSIKDAPPKKQTHYVSSEILTESFALFQYCQVHIGT